MIKFWKSADKGKTGCPVRPPELNSLNNADKTIIDGQTGNINSDKHLELKKKSKLTLNLHDILVKKIALNYLLHFLDSIGKHIIIKCWLDIEHFKTILKNNSKTNINDTSESQSKICRCTSFELNNDTCIINRRSHNKSQIKTKSTSYCEDLERTLVEQHDQSDLHQGNITDEAISLFKKYVALEAPNQLDLTDNVRKSIISNICQPEGLIGEECFQPLQDFLYAQIEQKYFNEFQNSAFYTKAQIDILTTENLGLEDIIYCDTLLFYFTEYLEQESSRILLEFLMAVTHFKDSFDKTSSEIFQADAIVIYDKYISLQATSPIGFPTDIRLQVESDICREGGTLSNCFDIPLHIVFKTLTSYVKTFLESELYYKYLSEMVHTVNQKSPNHKSHSDCSSEFSISTHNTLLAMGDPIFNKKKRNHSVPDMTIDSNQLYNADALWQRKRHDGLILGRVNSLGRFESKFEPDPDKKRQSVLKKMVSRFVPTSPSKVEEEMAWQIAHMIVKDVTDLTMTPPDNDRDEF